MESQLYMYVNNMKTSGVVYMKCKTIQIVASISFFLLLKKNIVVEQVEKN